MKSENNGGTIMRWNWYGLTDKQLKWNIVISVLMCLIVGLTINAIAREVVIFKSLPITTVFFIIVFVILYQLGPAIVTKVIE